MCACARAVCAFCVRPASCHLCHTPLRLVLLGWVCHAQRCARNLALLSRAVLQVGYAARLSALSRRRRWALLGVVVLCSATPVFCARAGAQDDVRRCYGMVAFRSAVPFRGALCRARCTGQGIAWRVRHALHRASLCEPIGHARSGAQGVVERSWPAQLVLACAHSGARGVVLQCCWLQCGAAPSRPPATPAAGRCLARMFSATRRRHVAPAGHARSPAQGIVRHCCFSAVQLVCLRCPAVAVGVAVGPRGSAARRLQRIGPETRLLPYTGRGCRRCHRADRPCGKTPSARRPGNLVTRP